MRRLKGEDNSFLAWESTTQPQHTIKAVVLDPNQGHEPLTFDTVKTRFPGVVDRVEPLQRLDVGLEHDERGAATEAFERPHVPPL